MGFTNEEIKKLEPGKTLWDKGSRDSESGLHVRALASGKKNFMLYYRTKAGVERRPKIGEFPAITIGEARRRANILNSKVAIGEDPKGEWDTAKKEITVGEIYRLALENYWSTPRFIRSRRKTDVENLWRNYLEAKFDSMRISQATTVVVKNWHTSLSETPYAANRAKEVLSRIFTYGEEHGHCPPHTNPCPAVTAYQEKSRSRFAEEGELKSIMRLLEKYSEVSPKGVAYLTLLLFTGSRPSAIERATWDQLKTFKKDGETYGVLTFDGKTTEETGEQEVVILPPQAMKVLMRLPRIRNGTITNSKMPQRLWEKIRREAGCGDLWARDLRRTFATIGLSSGVNIGTIGELLNHKSTQTTKAYAKLVSGARIEAAVSIANKIDQIITEEK